MFAVVRLGNRHFKVKAGDFIRAPFQNHSRGDKINIPVVAFFREKNLIMGDNPQLKSARVKAVLIRQLLDRKILVFKKKRRKGYRRLRGHRQKISELQILELKSPEGELSQVEWKGKVQATQKTKASSSQKELKSATPQNPQASQQDKKVKTAKKSHKKVQKQAIQAKKMEANTLNTKQAEKAVKKQ